MPLNIKNDEVERLVGALSELTGESKTQAIKEAVRQRLAREQDRQRQVCLAEELREIGRRCAQLVRDRPLPHGDFLYDERGLPRK